LSKNWSYLWSSRRYCWWSSDLCN